MSKTSQAYATTIVKDLLKLRAGDALSINTEEVDLEFAKEIANTALPITNVTVKIVVTEKGKPTQVLEFDPAPPALDPQGFAMLRLAHESQANVQDKSGYLDMIVDKEDLVTVQKFGHLAEPVLLNRRISVPWCVAKVHEEAEKWHEIDNKIDLGISNQSLVADYRRQYLQQSDSTLLHITGENTDFTVRVPEGARFLGGTQVLPDGRKFLNSLDFDVVSFITDCNSLDGVLQAHCQVLGKELDCTLTFKDGLLVDWTHVKELDRLFEFDENLKKPGFFSFRDKEFTLNLGGSLVEGLATIPEEESLLPSYFNRCLYTLKLHLDSKLNIFATNCEGKTTELVRKGFFLQ
jgi:leucyl aminopeptidase (aminopeptidase T)